MTAHRLRGRSDGNMKRDDEKHRATLTAILQPVRADVAGKALGVDAEAFAARLRKLVQAGMAQRLSGARWQITDVGRAALASDDLISLGVRREAPPVQTEEGVDVWALLLGAKRPEKVSGKFQGKMRMGRA
jgi:predicted transcriptional regulator